VSELGRMNDHVDCAPAPLRTSRRVEVHWRDQGCLAWIIHDFTGEKRKDALKGVMNNGFCEHSILFRSIPEMTSCCIPQLSFSFFRHRSVRADFSGGQISSDAGLLALRAFDQRLWAYSRAGRTAVHTTDDKFGGSDHCTDRARGHWEVN